MSKTTAAAIEAWDDLIAKSETGGIVTGIGAGGHRVTSVHPASPDPSPPPAPDAGAPRAGGQPQSSAEMEKAGEGSRGGHIIGHTTSGKAIYANPHSASSFESAHKDWTAEDHSEAADDHMHEHNVAQHTSGKAKLKGEPTKEHDDQAKFHKYMANAHREAASGSGSGAGMAMMASGHYGAGQPQEHAAMGKSELSKAVPGEGSRGGHIIGHTTSGKAIYAAKHATANSFAHATQGWSEQDHREAAEDHQSERDNAEHKADNHIGPASTARGKYHSKMAYAHTQAANSIKNTDDKNTSSGQAQEASQVAHKAAGHFAAAFKGKTMTKADLSDRSLLDLAMHEHPAAMAITKALEIGAIEPFHEELMVKSERGWLPIGDRSPLFDVGSDELSKGAIYIGPHGGKWADSAHTVPYKEAKHGGDRPEPKSAKIADATDPAVQELHMHIDNTEHLTNETITHHNPWSPGAKGFETQTIRGAVHKNLANKMGGGKYDHALATKMWGHVADRASKEYNKEHNNRSGHAFSPEVRRRVAHNMADEFHAKAKAGEMDHHLNKKNANIMHGSLKNDPNMLANAKLAHAKARGDHEEAAKLQASHDSMTKPRTKKTPGADITTPVISHPEMMGNFKGLTHGFSKDDHKESAGAHARLARETADAHEKYRKNAIANHGQSEGMQSAGTDPKFPEATNQHLRNLNAKKNFHLDASVAHHKASGARKQWIDADHGGKVFHTSPEQHAAQAKVDAISNSDIKKSERATLQLLKSEMAKPGTIITQGSLAIEQGPDYNRLATQHSHAPLYRPRPEGKEVIVGKPDVVGPQRMGSEGQLVRPGNGLRFRPESK